MKKRFLKGRFDDIYLLIISLLSYILFCIVYCLVSFVLGLNKVLCFCNMLSFEIGIDFCLSFINYYICNFNGQFIIQSVLCV